MDRVTDLSKLLTDPTRQAVVADLAELADTTVSNQSGLTGMALKSAVAAGKRADADAIHKGINQLLPRMVEELKPYYAAYENSGDNDFGAYLASREDEVVQSFLTVGDDFAQKAPAPIQKVYSSLRGKAGKIVAPALPGFGRIVEKHAQ